MKSRSLRIALASIACVGLIACASSTNYAPVMDVSAFESIPKSGTYRVRKGDTLYSIAWRYGFDYQKLASMNNISLPYEIHSGQVLYLRKIAKSTKVVMLKAPAKKAKRVESVRGEPHYRVYTWAWPTHGKVINRFSVKRNGATIGGKLGQAVVATAPGKVVYAGNGLRGYGNLVILKHNQQYLSAYAYNKKLLVREGQWVRRGQKIAEMGKGVSMRPMLHFEIRKAGRPVNPIRLLSAK